MHSGSFEGVGNWQTIVKYRDSVSWAVQKQLNLSRCFLGCEQSGSKEPCIRWGQDPHMRGNFEGEKGGLLWSTGSHSCELCKNGEPSEMSFGVWTWVGPEKHVLDGVTLAQPGEYNWTIHVQWEWGLFVRLLWPLVMIGYTELTFHCACVTWQSLMMTVLCGLWYSCHHTWYSTTCRQTR